VFLLSGLRCVVRGAWCVVGWCGGLWQFVVLFAVDDNTVFPPFFTCLTKTTSTNRNNKEKKKTTSVRPRQQKHKPSKEAQHNHAGITQIARLTRPFLLQALSHPGAHPETPGADVRGLCRRSWANIQPLRNKGSNQSTNQPTKT